MHACRPDGKRYEGQWVNGKQEGEGKFKDANGKTMTGRWKDGKFVEGSSKPVKKQNDTNEPNTADNNT